LEIIKYLNKNFDSRHIVGIAIVLFGILLLIRNVFNIHFPIFPSLFALIIIAVGIFIVKSSFSVPSEKTGKPLEEEKGQDPISISPPDPGTDRKQEYQAYNSHQRVIFGSGIINLKNQAKDKHIDINAECMFGEMKILIDPGTPIAVNASIFAGSLKIPGSIGKQSGNLNYMSPLYNPAQPGIQFNLNISFGETSIIELF
jgi:predicted membrane protein